ncbi:MAG: serine/threonine protein kinase [Lachnospiraceae bacterium]|nr:serine/threonine protein kinase [Lachnospiraceae bacterium]
MDRYRIISVLSSHEHSTVWLAEHKALGDLRIIKGIPRSSCYHDVLVREAHLLKHLNSPFIPIIYDVEEDDDYTYIVEQYIEGESLGVMCTHRLLSEYEVFHIILRISSIIKYLHTLPEKIYYLDLKPENIIVAGQEAYLVDFGSAVSESAKLSQGLFGTAGFSAPEQSSGKNVSERTDVYALGRLLEYMVNHSGIDNAMRDRLLKVVQKACSREWWKRISDVDIFIKMLEKLKNGKTETKEGGKKENAKQANSFEGTRIGVFGLSAGCGTTTVALALAAYLAGKDCEKVCFVEQDDHDDIRALMESVGVRSRTGMYEIDRVRYLAGKSCRNKAGFLNEKYDAMVFDLGSDAQKAMSTLRLCDRKIVIGSSAVWRSKEYEFLTMLKGRETENWFLLVNLADSTILRNMRGYGIGMLPFPWEPDPLHPDAAAARVFEKTLRMTP